MKLKTISKIILLTLSLGLTISSCEKDTQSEQVIPQDVEKTSQSKTSNGGLNAIVTSPYIVSLESKTKNSDGTFTWVWSVLNSNPGKGKIGSGTAQDLSHWGMTLGNCATVADVVAGATSADGVKWNTFAPSLQLDKSQICSLNPVIKFELGTIGAKKSYYSLTIKKDLETANVIALFKSGTSTGCGLFMFPGFGCLRSTVDDSLQSRTGFTVNNPFQIAINYKKGQALA